MKCAWNFRQIKIYLSFSFSLIYLFIFRKAMFGGTKLFKKKKRKSEYFEIASRTKELARKI